MDTHRQCCSHDLKAHPFQADLVRLVLTVCGPHLADAPGDGVEGDALLGHAPIGLGHQLDQRVQRDLQPRNVLEGCRSFFAAAACFSHNVSQCHVSNGQVVHKDVRYV